MTTTELTCYSGLHPANAQKDSRGGCKACSDKARLARVESRVERMKSLISEAQPPRPGWQVEARCSGEDPTMFLPVDGRGQTADVIAALNLERHSQAKLMCWACPVQRDCLGFALLGEQNQYGTWGSEFFVEADWTAAKVARKELGL